MKSVRTTLAYLAAAMVTAFGLLALLNPLVTVRLVGLEVIEPRGLSEVRATYGAMFLLMGGILVWAVPMRPRSVPWLRLVALVFGAAALGRLASVVLDAVWTPLNLAILAGTAFVAVVLFLASFQDPRAGDGAPAGRRERRGAGRLPRAEAEPAEEDVPDPLRAYRS